VLENRRGREGGRERTYLTAERFEILAQTGLDQEVEEGVARVEVQGRKGKGQRGQVLRGEREGGREGGRGR